ncbi:MAG: HDOD domain-containing protein [Pseudomonadales bacterium]|nr:HDOD domain-containing protein [Pseudomonadales bacterium]
MTSPAIEMTSMHDSEIFLARQPIFNRCLQVVGYELLYRSDSGDAANVSDGNQATAQLIINAFLEIGLENLIGNRLAFINMTRDYLLGEIKLPFENTNLVLEVLEDVRVDDDCIAGIKALAGRGFKIALDDFMLTEENRQLLPLASIVKVDILAMDEALLRHQVSVLAQYPVKLLAEKVESDAEFQLCKELGFEFFQGYFFAKPRIVSGRQIPANQLTVLQIIARLQSPDCDLMHLEQIISQDVGISHKLLRIINSSFYGMSSKVDSIQRAMMVLGIRALKNWIMVISLSMLSTKTVELLNISLIRARMCEGLAVWVQCKSESAFAMGLFSLLDALMDQPLPELLARLPLSSEITEALLGRTGALGGLLQAVTAYEKGQWETLENATIPQQSLQPAYVEAVKWSNDIVAQLG